MGFLEPGEDIAIETMSLKPTDAPRVASARMACRAIVIFEMLVVGASRGNLGFLDKILGSLGWPKLSARRKLEIS